MYFTIADRHSLYHTRLCLLIDLKIITQDLLLVHANQL